MKQIRINLLFLLSMALAMPAFGQFGPGMGFKADCTPLPLYKFDGDMKMRTQVKMEDRDTITMDITALVANAGNYMGVLMDGIPGAGSAGGMKMVVDLKDSVAYMMMDLGGETKGMCMDMNSSKVREQVKNAQQDSSFNFSKYKKTGKTRKILGYTCEEYLYKDNERSRSFWITNEAGDWWQAYNKAWSGASNGTPMPEGFKGMMLGMTMIEKKGKEITTTVMEVVELNQKKATEISTAGYFKK